MNINSVSHIMINVYIFSFLDETDGTCFSLMVNSRVISNIIISDIFQRFFLILASSINKPLKAID